MLDCALLTKNKNDSTCSGIAKKIKQSTCGQQQGKNM